MCYDFYLLLFILQYFIVQHFKLVFFRNVKDYNGLEVNLL